MGKSKSRHLDEIELRIILFLLGAMFLGMGLFEVLTTEETITDIAIFFLVLLFGLGVPLVFVSIAGSDNLVGKWSIIVPGSEILVWILVAISFPLAWIIRRLSRRTG